MAGRLFRFPGFKPIPTNEKRHVVPEDIATAYETPSPYYLGRAQQNASRLGRAVVAFPPEFLAPPSAVWIQPVAQVQVNAASNLVWTFTVPSASVLVIQQLFVLCDSISLLAPKTFRLTQNNSPVPGFDAITPFQPTAAAAQSQIDYQHLTLRFGPSVTVQLFCDTSVFPDASWVYSRAIGFFYSQTVAQQFSLGIG